MTITCITATCDRHVAFSLAEKWMKSQTRQPDQWLVLDDSLEPVKCTMGQQHVLLPQFRGKGSMVSKIRHAIQDKLIKGEIIIFWEDDDYYAPTYLAWCEESLKINFLIGEGRNLYYNVEHRWWFDHGNMGHASLCATAMRSALIPLLLRECASDDPFIDSRLWRNCGLRKQVFDPTKLRRRLTVGIKSMPGIRGYGSGHDRDAGWAVKDPTMKKLRELLGASAENYAQFYDEPPPPKVIEQATTMPKVEVHIVAFNEETILPYTLRHYKAFASRIIIHDGGSTDRTKAIAEAAGVEVRHWETEGKINDSLLRELKENAWRGTDADWVIMADADEMLYFPSGAEESIRAYMKSGVVAVKPRGFEMESPVMPTTQGQIYEEINCGAPDDRWYAKPIMFSPHKVTKVHFTHGAHEAAFDLVDGRRLQNPTRVSEPTALLLHYHHIGSVERIGERYDGNKSRFSDANKKNGWGWQGDGRFHAMVKRSEILKHRRKVV